MSFTRSTATTYRAHMLYTSHVTDRGLQVWTRLAHEHTPPTFSQPLRYLMAVTAPPASLSVSKRQKEAIERHLHA